MLDRVHVSRPVPLPTPAFRPLPVPLSAYEVSQPSGQGVAWIVEADGGLSIVDGSGGRTPIPVPDGGRAVDVSFGTDGTVWLLTTGTGGDALVFRGDPGGAFEAVPVRSSLRRIAGGPDGTVWGVDADHQVLSWAPDGTEHRHSPAGTPFADEISAGADGSVWVVSTTPRFGGRIVRRLAANATDWFDIPAPASAVRLSVGLDGTAWTVNAQGALWRLHPTGGGSFAECQVDTACQLCRFSAPADLVHEVSAGPDGTVWTLITSAGTVENPVLAWLTDPVDRRYRRLDLPVAPRRIAAAPEPALDPRAAAPARDPRADVG